MNRFYGEITTKGIGILSEEESRHCALILRHKKGDQIEVLDGKGKIYQSNLTHVSKNQCEFQVHKTFEIKPKDFLVHLLVAPTKNMDRMEWMIEKLVEIGVDRVSFITTQNSERRKLRMDRLEKKAISAMKQSGNPFLTTIDDLILLKEAVENDRSEVKLIAHVNQAHSYIGDKIQPGKDITILIGPEGDFTREEVDYAVKNGFQPISLGPNTLRTETAGFVACCQLNFINKA